MLGSLSLACVPKGRIMSADTKSAVGVSASEPISSSDVRDRLKLWEILELFLSAVDNKATVGDFRNFLLSLDIKERRT
jgi:hypothetical protein